MFTLTNHHKAIKDFAENGTGNFCINAGPGSGKTTTLFQVVIPALMKTGRENGVAFAFNKKNALDFETANRWPGQIQCSTIHAFCLRLIKAEFPYIKVDAPSEGGKKYGKWIPANPGKVKRLIDSNYPDISEAESVMVARLVSLGQNNALGIGDNPEISMASFRDLMEKYSIKQPDGEESADIAATAFDVFNLCIKDKKVIDFGDMPYFVIKNGVKLPKLDFLCFDEAQDMFPIILELLKLFRNQGTRIIAVGDPNQAINNFAGSMDSAIDNLAITVNAKMFSLPVSYRCCIEAVNLANSIIPDTVIACEGAKQGSIEYISIKEFDGDSLDENALVISRVHKALVPIAYSFMRKGRKFRYKGIKKVAGQMSRSLFHATRGANNNEDLTEIRANLVRFLEEKMEKAGEKVPNWLKDLKDNIETLCDLIIAVQMDGGNLKTVKTYLDTLAAAEDNTFGPTISSIHACKGAQSDNLFLVGPLKMDAPNMTEIEKQAELYAQYVAYTRGSDKITFVSLER
jgi:superfamily I DNA/RNA helicase